MQGDLFLEDELPVAPRQNERLGDMHRMYGVTENAICGNCVYFVRYHRSNRWAKCSKTRTTASRATDWKARNAACGLFEVETDR